MKARFSPAVLIRYGIAVPAGLLCAFLVLSLQGYSSAAPADDRYRLLADAFSIPGVIFLCFGVLIRIGNGGFFRGLTYAVGRAVRALIPFGRNRYAGETYYDYCRRKEEAGGVRGYGFLFVTGAVLLIVAAVFIILFYRVYDPTQPPTP